MVTKSEPARAPFFVGLFNPLARRALRFGALLGPNALITVRGRKTGLQRTTPVALVELQGRRWVIGTFGEVNWVRNLRAARQATLSVGKHADSVTSAELSQEAKVEFFSRVLGPYVRSLPVGSLLLSILGARDILDEPAAAAQRRPVFELRQA